MNARLSMVACAIGSLALAGHAAAQVTTYQARPQWDAATSPLGVMHCEDIEGEQPGSFPTSYSTQNGWLFVDGGGTPQSVQILLPPNPLNATRVIAFRDNGGGVGMNAPCDPSVAMGFDYFTASPWSITVGTQTFALTVGAPSFFGFTSGTQLQSVLFTSPVGGSQIILDNLCCITGKIGPALGACCHLQQGATVCSFVTSDECAALGGTFQGVGVPCDPNPCPIPGIGACCHPDGPGSLLCSHLSINECAALGGTFYGVGTSCVLIGCNPLAFGACCFEGSAGITCAIVTKEECLFVNGTYFGDDTVCDPNPCPVVPGNCNAVSGDCCAGRPNINDPFYQTFPPLVTVGTASPIANGPAVVNIFGIVNPNAPLNTDMGAPIYSHASWTEQNLGPVFGVAIDADGNIYVTGTRCYGIWATGAPGALGGTYGIVYRLDSTTGAASIFAALPNANDTGLGNITYDCGNDQFFVTNMEDGKIYRLSSAGATLSTYDFGTPDDPTDIFSPLGDRLWAVEVHNNRVYFSVWWEDAGNPSVANSNEIWSIALDGSGDFTGAPQLEVTVQPNPSSSYSNPVSDMRFTPTGSMLLAERGMTSATEPTPHQSRLLEFECVGGNWVPSANTFGVGIIGGGTNTAGGVDMDFDTGGRVYATGDALQLGPDIIYGMQGLPATGGDVTTSTLIDYNGSLLFYDKTQIGSVAVPCPDSGCMNVDSMKILCPTETNDCFTATFNITNKSGQPVKYVTIPLHPDPNSPITINPNIINLLTQDGSLLEDGETTTITITICNAVPGEEFCLTLSLITPGFEICCFDEICFNLPDCDCGQLLDQEIIEVQCPTPGQVTFTYNFTLENLSGFPAQWVIFVPNKDETAYFGKDFFFLPPLVPGSSLPMSVTIIGAVPGETFCFNILMQHPGSQSGCCCAFEKCIIIPECDTAPNALCRADLNNDNNVGVPDLLTVINTWGPCPTTCPPGCLADINLDCNVGVPDLLSLINQWGPCSD